MIIDGRGKEDDIPYEKLKELIIKDGCLLKDTIEVWVDREGLAKNINLLATLAGYDTVIESGHDHWILKVDVSHRRCL